MYTEAISFRKVRLTFNYRILLLLILLLIWEFAVDYFTWFKKDL